MHPIEAFEKDQITKLTEGKTIPNFRSGDTVKVSVKITEGTNQRIQDFEGVVIGRRNRGLGSSFIVRKIIQGEGVERNFKLYSPLISAITVTREGIVRRAKINYLRKLSGKKARIRQRIHQTKRS